MIGHEAARNYLEAHLPPATLLIGPPSVGKWTLAVHLADYHRVAPVDRWMVEFGFNIDTVRLVTSYAARSPHGSFKLVVARLDEGSKPALNALLKTLEEPPPRVRFILLTHSKTLPTIASRCTLFELGMLSREELDSVYREQGMGTNQAHRAAQYARGQVARGYEAENAVNHRNQVINLAKSLATGDRDLFNAVFHTWDGACTDMLTTLFTECLTQRWSTFTEQDTFGLYLDRARMWRMVSALTKLPTARPRLGIRAVLEPFLAR